ncbi:hypothetical protein J3R83DRAFT_9310, partial [Lanmaoa asiatica]
TEVVEVDSDRGNVIDGGRCNGIGPMSVRNERVINTNTLRQDVDPGDPSMGEEVESEVIQDNRNRENDGDGVHGDGRRCGMSGATSSARSDSKRVNTKMLAREEASQREWYKRTKVNIPGSSRPPPEYPRLPTNYVDPPRR